MPHGGASVLVGGGGVPPCLPPTMGNPVVCNSWKDRGQRTEKVTYRDGCPPQKVCKSICCYNSHHIMFNTSIPSFMGEE